MQYCFNPHFTRMRSEILTYDSFAKGILECFNPHFTRMRSEIMNMLPENEQKIMFQSSFYEDAL